MSLQLAAQHMASRGRGPDTTLVHMAPQEVAGLQALAKAHGGSLTINPETGLAEAGFLKSILPMVIGAGITAATGGAAAPWMIGLGLGGAETLRTGSLQKGLMAGLGAYGGAGIAGGLMGAGAGAAQQAAMAGVGETAGLSGLDAGMGAMPTGTIGATTATAPVANLGNLATTPDLYGNTVGDIASAYGYAPPPAAAPVSATFADQAVATTTQAPMLSQQGLMNQAAADATKAYQSSGVFDQLGAGAREVMNDPSRFMTKENLKYGLAGLAPVAMDMMTPQQMAEKEKLKPFEYTYSPGRVEDPQAGYTGAYTGERTYFNPIYTRTAAGGGLMDIGPVESMSRVNQSQMAPAYAQGGVSDMAVNPYTGSEMFAEGGAVKPVEENPYYTMSGQSGDAFKYLMGQMPAASRAPAAAPMAAPSALVQAAAPTAQTQAEAKTTMRPYTFDPMTGTFTAMPIVAPQPVVASAFGNYTDSGSGNGGFDGGGGYGGGGYGGGDTSGGYGDSAGYGAATGGLMRKHMAQGGIASLAQGGQSHLGDYSDGGRLLKGPGDGVSDSIPATIADKRPARLADGEFVVPARIVSELGNGSTEAGARKLYAMMDRVQKARKKSIGQNRVAVNSRAEKLLPA